VLVLEKGVLPVEGSGVLVVVVVVDAEMVGQETEHQVRMGRQSTNWEDPHVSPIFNPPLTIFECLLQWE